MHVTGEVTAGTLLTIATVIVVVVGSAANNAAEIAVALFQDSGNDALAVGVCHSEVGTAPQTISFTHYMTAGTTSSTTFKVRAGANAGNFTINGGAGNYGGVLASSITISEIVP